MQLVHLLMLFLMIKMTNNKPNYGKARYMADLTFSKTTSHVYPVNLLEIISNIKYEINLYTYNELSKKINISVELIIAYGGPDAFVALKEDGKTHKFVIFYNGDIKNNIVERIRFSIAHELGHILLNHFDENDSPVLRRGLDDEEYLKYEHEADSFANELLVPPSLVNTKLDARTVHRLFDVSNSAAQISLNIKLEHPGLKPSGTLIRSLKNTNKIFQSYFNFNQKTARDLKEACQKLIDFTLIHSPIIYFCKNCNNGEKIFLSELKYCPICGNKNLLKITEDQYYKFHETEERNLMSYSSLKVDEKGHLKENCPICGNKHVSENYCSICGVYLVNKCTGIIIDENGNETENEPCDIVLKGSDRYCPICGAKSTFFTNGLLKRWDADLENQVIDIPDDALPF